MLQRTVDGQPPRHDGAATGWFQGVPYRLLAGRPAEGGFGLLAPRKHLVARGAKWATKLCPPVLHLPCEPPPPTPPIRLPELEELPGGARPLTDRPVRSDVQARSGQRALHPQFRAGVGWHGRRFYASALPSIRCKPGCVPRSVHLKAVVSRLLPIVRDQHMLVPVAAPRRMLLAISCLGHVQQRPGSDLPSCGRG
jgi:hypothetical protein